MNLSDYLNYVIEKMAKLCSVECTAQMVINLKNLSD